MFRTDSPKNEAAPYTPRDADALLDEFLSDPAEDDYFDRCLFELRQSNSDFRNL